MTWQQDFAPDGALRDIVVQDASRDDWLKVLQLVESRYRPFRFTVGGDTMHEIDRRALFVSEENRPLLQFHVGDTELACHFFDESEIEFDFYPNDIMTEEQLAPLLRFLSDIGSATGKTAILTPENDHNAVIFQFSADSGVVHYVAAV